MISTTVETSSSTENPFPGLRPFRMEESHLFFGREGQTDEVLLKLSKNRFVGVVGPSGAGKSSFIYCGVLPILHGGFLTSVSPDWEVIMLRPGSTPVDNLAESLLSVDARDRHYNAEELRIKRTIYASLLRSSSLGLVEAVEQQRNQTPLNYLILVDQFEELFRYKDMDDHRRTDEVVAFINLLTEACRYADVPIYVALTMRSDFIGECAMYPELTRQINDSHYLIPQLTRDQKRRAIEGPVAVGGAQISSRLVQQLLNDLGDKADQLPILQHALMRTWDYWSRHHQNSAEPLDLSHYEAIGTMSEALSMHANEAYDELTEEQKYICEILFKAITEKRGENFGIRRPTRLDEIAQLSDVSQDQVIEVVDKFRDPGRSLLTPSIGTTLVGSSVIDLSHESLMRIWTRLKGWVEDEAEAVQMYTRLAEAATMYQIGKAGLWRPPDLQLALNWQTKHKPSLIWAQRYHPAFERTMAFLEFSKKEWETEQRIKELQQKRKLKTARVVALVLGGLTILALLAFVFAGLKQTEAMRNYANMIIQRDSARAAQLEAQRQEQIAQNEKERAERERLYAVEQERIAIAEKENALRQQRIAEEQRALALRNERLATANADLANREKLRAEDNEKTANANARRALEQERRARALRYRAIAKAMAIKSVQLSDPEQEALLAQQAFNFNTSFEGYEYDDDIYDGLYNALKRYNDPLTTNLIGHKNNVRALVSSPSTNVIYSGGAEGAILRWKREGEIWTSEVIVGDAGYRLISAIDISADGRWLAVAGNFNTADPSRNFVELYDLKTPRAPAKVLEGYQGEVGHLIFAPDGKGFFTRDKEGYSIKYSDLTSSREVISSREKIRSISLSPDGKTLLGVSDGNGKGNLIAWDTGNFAESVIYRHDRGLFAVAFSPDGHVVIGDVNGEVKIVRTNGTILSELSGHESAIQDIKFSHSGQFMATASKDRTVRLWNLKALKEQPIKLYDHPNWVWSIAFTPDDEQLLAGTQEQIIKSWPTRVETMSGRLCGMVTRNMTQDEWDIFVSEDLDYVNTCERFSSSK